jgi:hypothetical protein
MRARPHSAIVSIFALTVASLAPGRAGADQRTFATADAAARALVEAAGSDDTGTLLAILGPEGEPIVSSGDPVRDLLQRQRFAKRAAEAVRIEEDGPDRAALSVGADDWPFAIPIVREDGAWRFDTAQGLQELLNRRIGSNELRTIDVCRAFVAAEREYAAHDHDGDGVLEHAQRILSSVGARDGLSWPTAEGEPRSPLGPLVASAAAEGYTRPEAGSPPRPYHGYVYRVLTGQGRHAPGGAKGYIENGNMTGGFALLAYPIEYGQSGIMTFTVNQQGVVFQKDLGDRTAELASAIQVYDPDGSWMPTR